MPASVLGCLFASMLAAPPTKAAPPPADAPAPTSTPSPAATPGAAKPEAPGASDPSEADGAESAEPSGDVTRYTFTGLDIDGELRTPALLQFLARIAGEFETVGIPHRSFMPELRRTAASDAL